MALDQTNAAIATLNELAPQLVTELQASQSAEKQAQSDLAGADATVSAQLQQIISLLQPLVLAGQAAPAQ